MNHAYDTFYMQLCLSIATRGWGTTLTNPLVGAIIVKNHRIVGRGFHWKRGEAHAETIALIDAGRQAHGATLYVNLEPCCCAGRTPPCVPAIIRAGIARVVIGETDPNPRVNGQGIEQLRAGGIDVQVGVLSQQAHDLNRAYRTWILHTIPYTVLKIAVSANGKVSGFPKKYITSTPSLRYVHAVRSRVSAVLVGITTVQNADPLLTDRLVGRHDPARIILDPDLTIPPGARVLAPGVRRIIVTHNRDTTRLQTLTSLGVELHFYEGKLCSPTALRRVLGIMDIGSIMVEGGATVFTHFFDENAYDEIMLFMAPHHVPQGSSLTDRILQSIVSQDEHPEQIGEDRLYHVYRDH
jgi:diaminohydroxyphosphoribosylaminopyrimidine deaminase/5-amino-6-(5-phosphoribosylamino)uracil reductase